MAADAVEGKKESPSALVTTAGAKSKALGKGKADPVAMFSPSPPVVVGGGNVPEIYLRRRRHLIRTLLSLVAVVLLPTFLVAIYYTFLVSPRYVSETSLIVHSSNESETVAGDLISLIGGGQARDSLAQPELLYEYIRSSEMLRKLNDKLDLKAKYGSLEVDYFSRLPANANREEFLDYYRSRVEVEADPDKPVVKVRAQAFIAPDAQLILTEIVGLSEEALNRVYEKKRADTMRFAHQELHEAEARLSAARQNLNVFRHEYGDLDPQYSAQVVGGIAAGLSQELAAARAELEQMLSYLQPTSPQVVAQKVRLRALENQIQSNQARLAGADTSVYADRLREYQNLALEEHFAESMYTSAMAFVESSRADVQRQHNYVIDFVPPMVPEVATEPDRVRSVLTVFIIACLTYAIGALLITAIREHARL